MKRRSIDGQQENSRDPRSRASNPPPPCYTRLFTGNLELFNKNFPVFQLPRAVGFYSLDQDRNYNSDHSQLRYLALSKKSNIWTGSQTCNVSFNLRNGIEKAIEKDEESIQEKMLDDLLTWILQERVAKNPNIVDIANPLLPLSTEFVCFRGLLTLILATLYEHKEGWKIIASRHENSVYMFQIKDISNCWNSHNPRMREMALWGFKFEQYLCVDKLGAQPNPDEVLNTNSEFCCILKTRLAGHSLLYGAEIDALKDGHSPPWENLEHFVELKTTKKIESDRQYHSFRRFKGLKWWAQSFLVGIQTIICGYRDDDGIVTQLAAISVNQLRKDCDDIWKANICMNFLHQFLEFVNTVIPRDESSSTNYLFEYNPKMQAITATKDENTKCNRSLLPDWYLDVMRQPVD